MHPWRKLFTEWLSSSRLAVISDGAFRLWITLITAQDDAGELLWDRGKIKILVGATTEWDFGTCESYADELGEAGLLTRNEGYVTLYRGAEFNGILRPERDNSGFYYRSAEERGVSARSFPVTDDQVTASDGLEERKKRREVDKKKIKSRGKENSSSSKSNKSKTKHLFNHLTKACERDLGSVEQRLVSTLTEFAEGHPDLPVRWIDLAFEEAVSYEKVSWPYVAAILEAWIDQGHSGEEKKEYKRGKSRKDSSNDAKRNRPGAGFKPLSGRRARVS